ncbi:MAG: FAD-binding oxidoreductase, partial [Pseudomonadota bacterium]
MSNQSWYMASANQRDSHQALEGEIKCDVCIIGGGFTGASVALELCQKNIDTVLIEANHIGYGASGRNGGQICSGYNLGFDKLAKYFGHDEAKMAWDALESTKRLIEKRIKDHQIECDLNWGYLHVSLSQGDMDDFKALLDDWAKVGYSNQTRLVEKKEIRDFIASDAYIGGLIDDGAGHMHPLNYLIGIIKAARRHGLKIFENTPAQEIDFDKGWVRISKGIVHAEHLVLACNGYLDQSCLKDHSNILLQKVANHIVKIKSYMIASEPLTKKEANSLIADRRAVCDNHHIPCYYRMTHDHRLLFGARESSIFAPPKNLHHWLRQPLKGVFPQLEGIKIDYCWHGNLAITFNRMFDLGCIGKTGFYAQGYS